LRLETSALAEAPLPEFETAAELIEAGSKSLLSDMPAQHSASRQPGWLSLASAPSSFKKKLGDKSIAQHFYSGGCGEEFVE
jgi:hypothetical protein